MAEGKKKTIDDFELGEVIGEGSFGEVKIAVEKGTGARWAAKILSKKHIVKENKIKYVSSEKAILNRLRHPNIVQLYCTFQDKDNLYYILELCHAGDLLSQLQRVGAFDETCARFYAAEILSAVVCMHANGVAHRDVKPENVLLASSMHAKLSDFGCAKEFAEPRERSKSFCGTPEYVCPELLVEKCAGLEADMWSYGVVLYQLLNGKVPFRGINEYHTLQAVILGEYHLPQWLSNEAMDLIKKLLVKEPAQRITAAEAKAHPFFAEVDWDSLHKQTPPPIVRAPFWVPVELVQPSISPQSSPVTESPPHSPDMSCQDSTQDLSSSISSASSSISPSLSASPLASSLARAEVTNSPAPSAGAQTSPTVSPPPTPLSALTPFLGNIYNTPVTLSHCRSDYSNLKWLPMSTGEVVEGTVSMQKRSKFLTRKRLLVITNQRLVIANPTSTDVKCSVAWGSGNIIASSKGVKLLTITTDSHTFVLLSPSGEAQHWARVIQSKQVTKQPKGLRDSTSQLAPTNQSEPANQLKPTNQPEPASQPEPVNQP